MQPSRADCEKWNQNKLVNPLTGRAIQQGKGVYNQLEKACKEFRERLISPQPKPISPLPPSISKDSAIMRKLSKIRKGDCVGPKRTWIVGKGCFESQDRIVSAERSKLSEPKEVKPVLKAVVQEKVEAFDLSKHRVKNEEIGFHIGNITLKQLSGPISLYVLKPKASESVSQIKWPLLILAGDRHTPQLGESCDPCKSGCDFVFKTSFMGELEKLSAPTHPVEVSFEMFDTSKDLKITVNNQDQNGLEKMGMISSTESNFESCFKSKNSSAKAKSICKVGQNIRWQFADVRKLTRNFRKDLPLDYWFDAAFINIYNLPNLERSSLESLEFYKTLGTQLKKRCEKTKIDLEFVLSKIKTMCFDFATNMGKFWKDYVSDLSLSDISIIQKQIRKAGVVRQHQEIFDKLPRWFERYGEYVQQKNLKYPKEKEFVDIQNKSLNLISYFAKGGNDLQVAKNMFLNIGLSKLPQYLDNINTSKLAIFLDVYYILRLFKLGDNIVPPMLSLSLFGAAHSSHLKTLLVDIMGVYEVDYQKFDSLSLAGARGSRDSRKDNQSKCVTFTSSVDINYLAREWCERFGVVM